MALIGHPHIASSLTLAEFRSDWIQVTVASVSVMLFSSMLHLLSIGAEIFLVHAGMQAVIATDLLGVEENVILVLFLGKGSTEVFFGGGVKQ